MRDKFEIATLRAKTEQMFCVHTRAYLGGCLLSKYQNIIFFAMLNTWEDKLHNKMTSAYSKSCGYKKFSVHTNTKKYRFQIVPLWRAFSKSSVFVDLFMRISVDGSRIRNNKSCVFKFIRHSVDGALNNRRRSAARGRRTSLIVSDHMGTRLYASEATAEPKFE